MSGIAETLVIEEDEQAREQQADEDLISYLRHKLVDLHKKVSSYGTNIVTAKGIEKLSSEFHILVFGPARVGKSTLIQEISGGSTIETSANMDSCTRDTHKYIDKYNIQWWDTPGFENWSVEKAKEFFRTTFYDRQILPKVAIFCRTANSLGSTDVVKYMFQEIKRNGILLLYVITKWPFIPRTEQDSIISEAISLLGGRSTAIYSSQSRVCRALECEPKKSYIIPVNSKSDEVLGIRVKRSNLNTLRKILISKMDEKSQSALIQLYKDNVGFWTKLGYGAIEILDDLGIPTANTQLTQEEQEIYRQVKNGENITQIIVPVLKSALEKMFNK